MVDRKYRFDPIDRTGLVRTDGGDPNDFIVIPIANEICISHWELFTIASQNKLTLDLTQAFYKLFSEA